MGWELVAILAAGLFAGASVYINLVEHPARVQCGTELAVTEFGPSYHRATVMQVSLAVIGLIAGLGAWLSGSGVWWLIGGVTLGAVMPFTFLVIFPTNKKLLDPALPGGRSTPATSWQRGRGSTRYEACWAAGLSCSLSAC